MSILNDIIDVKLWEAFFTYKSENESFTKEEAKAIRTFIDEKRFYLSVISEECRYGEEREKQLGDLLSIKEKFD